ncbi:MAG TPA: ATP-binding protein [Thermoanaerobaculia bacterium]|nr:ATP-binding protein [Thermoanaerobaculia bacterium]
MGRTRTFRLISSLLLALLTVALCGLSVHRKVQSFQPLGFEAVSLVPGSGMVQVTAVSNQKTGLRQGDQLLLVNGGESSNTVDLAQRLRAQPASTLTVMRGAQLQEVRYTRPPLDPDFPYLILALIGGVYLMIGLYTLVRQGSSPGFLFHLWCLVSAAFYLLTPIPPLGVVYTVIHLGDKIARILLPALTLHLFLVFPSPFARGRRILPFLYIPAAVLLTLQADMAIWNGRWILGPLSDAKVIAVDRFELLYLVAFVLTAFAVLVYRMLREQGLEQQRQMRWVTFGLGGGYLPFLLLYVAPLELGFQPPELMTALAVLPLALVPLTFAWAILRYKLWDIEVIVRDTISSTLTLLLGIIGFSLVNLAINRGVAQELAAARNFLSFAAGLTIAGLLVPTRRHLSSALERMHYGGTFGKRRALSSLGRELLHERNLGELCTGLLADIEDGVALDRANLYLTQGREMAAARPEPELPARLACDALGDDFWREDVLRLSGVALPCEPMPPSQKLFVAGYRYAFPLTVRGRGVGIVLTGYRHDQTPLNSEDLELIRHLLDQAALAIENAQLLGQLHNQLEEVQRLQRYTEGIFESSPAGIAVLDADYHLLSANAAFAELAGRERDEMVGRRLEDVLPADPLPRAGEGPVEASLTDGAGRERFLQMSLADFDRGRREGLQILVVHDISERVAMENALREKDRLAALGMLAAGVAHEVNTPITGISSYAQMLLEDTPESDPHYAILKKVERQTFRAARIVNNLLEFARNRQKDRRPIDVAPLVTESLDLVGDRLQKRRVEVDWQAPAETIRVMGCDGELQQVFTNLILNALDAMSEAGGTLTIGLETDAAAVRVRVQDSGPGISPDRLQEIFQPFYSTKLSRGGTGLGLSISREIVRRHGGELRATSEPGQGACFTVEIPRYEAKALSEASA